MKPCDDVPKFAGTYRMNLFREPSRPDEPFEIEAEFEKFMSDVGFKDLLGRRPDGTIRAAETTPTAPATSYGPGGMPIFPGTQTFINSNSASPWFNGYPDRFRIADRYGANTLAAYQAMTLVHEFGHRVRMLRGGLAGLDYEPGAGGTTLSTENTRIIFENCFK